MDISRSGPAVSDVVVTTSPVLRLAVAAYLARFKGRSRVHTESDLRGYLLWSQSRHLDPLVAPRPQIELYVRWLQEVRRYRPATVSRRVSVVAGFCRTCVIDGVLEHSPAEYVRRPNVPAESPTLGLTHLQFEALLTAARTSANRYDFALVTMLGLLGLRIRGHRQQHRGPRPGARPPGAARSRHGRQGRPRPATPGRRPRDRAVHRRTAGRTHPADLAGAV
jgi:hypothetical protein